ncbi:unnamed protein product [Amoebophrya sp. A25]|nr:unnamed protein product [Amoebophrya sp. A25]|eukprot:GSA25T00005543001.1
MTTAHRPTFNNALGGENQGGNLIMAPTHKKCARDQPQELTMKLREAPWKTRAEIQEEIEKQAQAEEEAKLGSEQKGGSSASSSAGFSTKSKKSNKSAKASSERLLPADDDDDSDDGLSSVGGGAASSVFGGGAASSSSKITRVGLINRDGGLSANVAGFTKLPVLEGDNPFPEDADADFDSDVDAGTRKKADKDSDDDSDSDSDSDYEALQRELAKIRQEKEDAKQKEEEEAEKIAEADRREGIGASNPLINSNQSLKRAWNEDTVFKNQARTAPKVQKRFINDNVRSDFHKRFLHKYMAM